MSIHRSRALLLTATITALGALSLTFIAGAMRMPSVLIEVANETSDTLFIDARWDDRGGVTGSGAQELPPGKGVVLRQGRSVDTCMRVVESSRPVASVFLGGDRIALGDTLRLSLRPNDAGEPRLDPLEDCPSSLAYDRVRAGISPSHELDAPVWIRSMRSLWSR